MQWFVPVSFCPNNLYFFNLRGGPNENDRDHNPNQMRPNYERQNRVGEFQQSRICRCQTKCDPTSGNGARLLCRFLFLSRCLAMFYNQISELDEIDGVNLNGFLMKLCNQCETYFSRCAPRFDV